MNRGYPHPENVVAPFSLPRFYPIVDTKSPITVMRGPLKVFRTLIEAGARIIQLRHKDAWTRDSFRLAEAMTVLARDAAVTFVVNDRADVALAVGADGVHLGQTDLSPSAVRSFAGDKLIIGLSTHNREQLEAAAREPADYLALGPIFGTQSKERPDPTVGLEGLQLLRGLTNRPLAAIGGITREAAPEIWAAGADSCAVISDMLRDDWRASIQAWVRLAQRDGGT